jgi:hypothetical protein
MSQRYYGKEDKANVMRALINNRVGQCTCLCSKTHPITSAVIRDRDGRPCSEIRPFPESGGTEPEQLGCETGTRARKREQIE